MEIGRRRLAWLGWTFDGLDVHLYTLVSGRSWRACSAHGWWHRLSFRFLAALWVSAANRRSAALCSRGPGRGAGGRG